MKRRLPIVAGALMLIACGVTRSSVPPAGPSAPGHAMRAGLCASEAYLSNVCGDELPTRAVVIGPYADSSAAQKWLRDARTFGLDAGYPFAATLAEMPFEQANGRNDARPVIVLGLFADDAGARSLVAALATTGAKPHVERVSATRAPRPGGERMPTAVELLADAPAWDPDVLERIEHELDEALGRKWVPLALQKERRDRALSRIAPTCVVRRGSIFVTPRDQLFRFQRTYAPVTCPNGRSAFTQWRATRLEAVVHDSPAGLVIEQVVLVECDTPTIERRALSRENAHLAFALGSCGN